MMPRRICISAAASQISTATHRPPKCSLILQMNAPILIMQEHICVPIKRRGFWRLHQIRAPIRRNLWLACFPIQWKGHPTQETVWDNHYRVLHFFLERLKFDDIRELWSIIFILRAKNNGHGTSKRKGS